MARKLSSEVINLRNEAYHAKRKLDACIMSENIRKLYEVVRVAERRIKRMRQELEYNPYGDEFLFPLMVSDETPTDPKKDWSWLAPEEDK